MVSEFDKLEGEAEKFGEKEAENKLGVGQNQGQQDQGQYGQNQGQQDQGQYGQNQGQQDQDQYGEDRDQQRQQGY
jgi:hypothetical protein